MVEVNPGSDTNVTQDGAYLLSSSRLHRPNRMTEQQRQHIQQAETEFMATGYRPDDDEEDNVTFGNDASHRSGTAGFLKLSQDGNRIFIPDYTGNNMFNSIGNLLKDPRMG